MDGEMRWMDEAQASNLELAASGCELVHPGVLSTTWFSPFDEFNQNEQTNDGIREEGLQGIRRKNKGPRHPR